MAETAPLRGRHRELAELDALVDSARAGHSGALAVSGEAGVGDRTRRSPPTWSGRRSARGRAAARPPPARSWSGRRS
ncbi:hypothetical protein OG320_27340 [Microbispora sp. NBC_01189]|uniref:hypothetical protein n=1 Tax=Microbispora sp. NBC_01189 TaxID=2903583 RepID=UPI002E15C6A2|nr:hypothetical protein OG320_27340 [Microbispora sp. NBC_01189]